MDGNEQTDAANLKAAGLNDTGTGAAGTTNTGASPIPGAKPGEAAPGTAGVAKTEGSGEGELSEAQKADAAKEASIAGKTDNTRQARDPVAERIGDTHLYGKRDAFDLTKDGNTGPRLTNVNDPTKAAQIAKADEAMSRKNDENREGAKVLEEQHDDEEQLRERLADEQREPTTGKARDTNTPSIDKHGNRGW